MCGISAVIRFGAPADADIDALARMHDMQAHRGPDGEGAYFVNSHFEGVRTHGVRRTAGDRLSDARVMLAVRRLRVTDLRPEADQPIVSADGRVCVALNGAIYNYRELAEELKQGGAEFRSRSDAEVVLHAYRRSGTDCFARFEGMWAIVILDLDKAVLVLSRDRVGIKPLYYALDDGRMLLASEPRAVAAVQKDGPRAEPSRIFEFLSGYPARSSALSYFKGVRPVPPGSHSTLCLRGGRAEEPRFTVFWNLANFHAGERGPAISFDDAADKFRELLRASVGAQSLADAKIGSLLSGGMDTSTIVSLWAEIARQRGSQPAETFSIAWNIPEMSERHHAEAVAEKARAKSHVLELSPDHVWQAVDKTIAAVGQPLLGQELIAQNYAYGLAREHGATVVMDGSGSDEIQAGLPHYEAQMVYRRWLRRQYWDVMCELLAISRGYGLPLRRTISQYLISPIRRNRSEAAGLPRYSWLDESVEDNADEDWRSSYMVDRSRDPDWMNAVLYQKTRHTNLPAVLMMSDRNAMSHSIEARFPFLDHRILELLFSLPPDYKVGFGRRKKLLMEVSKDYLPQSVLARKDKKYFVLLSNWMPLRERAKALREGAYSPALAGMPGVRPDALASFVEDYLAGRHDNAYAVWRIYTTARWAEMFGL